MIRVYVTFGELASWMALSGLRDLMSKTGVEVELRPLLGSLGNVVTSKEQPGEADPLAEYKARRARARSLANAREFSRQCEILGIPEASGSRKIDPLMLSVGLNWLVQRKASTDLCLRYVELAFEQMYRADDADLDALEDVIALIERLGFTVERIHEFALAEAGRLEDQQEELLEQGILSAPAFIVQDQLFHGREHLPLIEWMLSGQNGPPPV